MAKTRRTYGWGCLPCNMQTGQMLDADSAWQEAALHTNSSGHVTDTFFRVDTQITTIYPQKKDLRVLTSLAPLPTQLQECGHGVGWGKCDLGCEEQQVFGPVNPKTEGKVYDPADGYDPNMTEPPATPITDKYLTEEKEDPAAGQFSPEAIKAIDQAADEYVKESSDAVPDTKEPSDQVS